MTHPVNEIERLIYDCFKEITDHTMQTDVLSPQIKSINANLKAMTELVEKLKTRDSSFNTAYARNYGQRETMRGDEKGNVIKLAYVLSRFDYYIINDILNSHYNQGEVFRVLSDKLKVKQNTLKNYRDAFDPHVKQERSNRRGWHQKELPADFQARKSLWDTRDHDFIKAEIEKIIK